MIGILIRLVLLAGLEAAVVAAAWWLNDTRREEGPVLLPLIHGHGIHRMDLLVVAAGLLVAIVVLGWPGRARGGAGTGIDPPIVRYPPNGTPRARRVGHDQ